MIKSALVDNADLNDAGDFTFFTQASKANNNLGGLICADSYCRAKNDVNNHPIRTTSGEDGFDPDAFHAIVVVGLRTELPYALWNGFQCGQPTQDGKQVISVATYDLALRDFIEEQALAIRVIREIRSISNCPILLVPCPYIDSEIRNTAIPPAPGYISDRKVTAGKITNEQSSLAGWKAILGEVMAPYDVKVLFQHNRTTSDFIFTRPEYVLGRSTPAEMRHMNSDYGKEIILQVIGALE
jgi:uncharacterized protein (DUF2384 family)